MASPDPTLAAEIELDEKFPHRPRNHSQTLPFHQLFLSLFNPLNENKKKPTGPPLARKKHGPHGPLNLSPHEIRRGIIEQFITRWRLEVGNDVFPAFRLILPDKDRERAMYGLKEKTIGKLLIKVMKINKDSEDGYNLLNWKHPGQSGVSRMAGDFAGRCFEVITKRPMRTDVGSMLIGEVNDLLDRLSSTQNEDAQLPIVTEFYKRMNAEELMWLIRIILRQMKVGATEKTYFNIWHPDAESLFSISSNLRRVCWELYDHSVRLEGDNRNIALMQCFQPQLAQFQMHDFSKMIAKMRPTKDDPVFWVEEKLDGERMQLHMMTDEAIPGGKRFGFWSRKAKDYSYLYGTGFKDEKAGLTRHLQDAFEDGVQSIILDGEMITWDPVEDAMIPFGTLKTAALEQQKNPLSRGHRPLYKVFDILYLNGQALTNYTLRDRRKALEASVRSVFRRLEIHNYVKAKSVLEVEKMLQRVVQEASEGLVLKNPRSAYRLNDRNDDWMKVKPEYMTEFGEALDCIVIGGYYGSGKRGGTFSSFLCGLRVDENQVDKSANPMKCHSFFKVGGGFTAADYANLRHRTEGKWITWDPKRPPNEYVVLGGGHLQYERPDCWIRPDDSVILSVKAASITMTDQFRTGCTLRFPRFKSLRTDRDWKSALSLSEFSQLRRNVETKMGEMKIDDSRKRKQRVPRKKPLTVAGSDVVLNTPYGGLSTSIFEGLNLYIVSESLKPDKRSKQEIEQMVKENGGTIFQQHNPSRKTICVGDRRTVKVAALVKEGKIDIVRPKWIFDCINQASNAGDERMLPIPLEPRHVFFTQNESEQQVKDSVDKFNDSFTRDVGVTELRDIFDAMPGCYEQPKSNHLFREQMQQHGQGLSRGWLFEGLLCYIENAQKPVSGENGSEPFSGSVEHLGLEARQIGNMIRFGGGQTTSHLANEDVTHVVLNKDKKRAMEIREFMAS